MRANKILETFLSVQDLDGDGYFFQYDFRDDLGLESNKDMEQVLKANGINTQGIQITVDDDLFVASALDQKLVQDLARDIVNGLELNERLNVREAQGLQQDIRSINRWLDTLAIRTGGHVKFDGGSTTDKMSTKGLMTRRAVIGRGSQTVDQGIKNKDFTVIVYERDQFMGQVSYYTAIGPEYFSDYREKTAATVIRELQAMSQALRD